MDDVRIWAAARTPEQIRLGMFAELQGNESGLRAYWKLNGTLEDSSGNGNTAYVSRRISESSLQTGGRYRQLR